MAGYDWAPDEVMPVDIDHIKRNFRAALIDGKGAGVRL